LQTFNHWVIKGNEAIKAATNEDYLAGNHYEILYQASGVAIDFFYEEVGIKYSLLIELRNDQMFKGFILPPDQIEPTGREIWAFHARVAGLLLEEFA